MPPEGQGNQQQQSQQQQQQGQQQSQQQQQPPATWETWLAAQPDDVKALYEQHTSGLRSALQSERDGRADLAKQLKALSKSAKEGSNEKQALEEITGRLEAAESQTAFYEDAIAQGVGNLRLAWIAAQSGEYLQRGKVNWAALKADYPELFKSPSSPPGNAGTGTGALPPAGKSMNEFIRRAAGRQ